MTAAVRNAARAAVPATSGRFELRRELGQGAQATVWLGFDARLEREVAVKLMHAAAAADPAVVRRWLQEARSVSRLTHPNIVPVFEADLHADQPYLVFEYVPGPTLAQHLNARGAWPAVEAVAMMVGVLDALHTAHVAGVVHRDLKPSNIMVTGSGRAQVMRVMDFGIAAHAGDAGAADGCFLGRPGADRGAQRHHAGGRARPDAGDATRRLGRRGLAVEPVVRGRRCLAVRAAARSNSCCAPAGAAANAGRWRRCADAARGPRFAVAARAACDRHRAPGSPAIGPRERRRSAGSGHPGHHELDGRGLQTSTMWST